MSLPVLCERCSQPTRLYFHRLCDNCIRMALEKRSYEMRPVLPMNYRQRIAIDRAVGANDDRLLAEVTQ